MDTYTFGTHMRDLPAELYNIIYEYTFTAPSGLRKIDKYYLPPYLLAVSRSSREFFARSYYGGSDVTFACEESSLVWKRIPQWLRSIPQHHLLLLNELKVMRYLHGRPIELSKADVVLCSRVEVQVALDIWRSWFAVNKLGKIRHAFCVEVTYDQRTERVVPSGDNEYEDVVVAKVRLDDPRLTHEEYDQLDRIHDLMDSYDSTMVANALFHRT